MKRAIVLVCSVCLLPQTALSGASFQGLGNLSFESHSQTLGVSADGSFAVGYYDSSPAILGFEAVRWTSDGNMVGLGDLEGGYFQSKAYAASADGSVVVGFGDPGDAPIDIEAFRWTSGGGMVGLGDLTGGSFASQARDVSADGSVVVGMSDSASGTEAFRWTSGGDMVGLGDLEGGSFGSQAYGVSADGTVVVGGGTSVTGTEAFIWDQINGMRSIQDMLINDFSLDLTGWKLNTASSISADGLTIVGYGNSPNGYIAGWVATIPEPATLTMLALGGLRILRRRSHAS